MLNETQPTIQLTSPQNWHEYEKVFYDIPDSHLSPTHMIHTHMNQPISTQKVSNSIDRLQFGKAQRS